MLLKFFNFIFFNRPAFIFLFQVINSSMYTKMSPWFHFGWVAIFSSSFSGCFLKFLVSSEPWVTFNTISSSLKSLYHSSFECLFIHHCTSSSTFSDQFKLFKSSKSLHCKSVVSLSSVEISFPSFDKIALCDFYFIILLFSDFHAATL